MLNPEPAATALNRTCKPEEGLVPHSGQSSQLFLNHNHGSAEFLPAVARSALNLPVTPSRERALKSRTCDCGSPEWTIFATLATQQQKQKGSAFSNGYEKGLWGHGTCKPNTTSVELGPHFTIFIADLDGYDCIGLPRSFKSLRPIVVFRIFTMDIP